MKKKQKKALLGSTLVVVVLGLFIIASVSFGIISPVGEFVKKRFFNEDTSSWQFPWNKENEEFEPYTLEDDLDREELIVLDSMKGLIQAINAVARNDSINAYQEVTIKPDETDIAYYTISFSANPELEETTPIGLNKDVVNIKKQKNEKRYWNFIKRFDINQEAKEITTQKTHKIYADYYYGSCTDENKGNFVICQPDSQVPKKKGPLEYSECYCNAEDDFSIGDMPGLPFTAKTDEKIWQKAKEKGLASIRDMNKIYNIELTTYDKEGNQLCKIGTRKGGKITDTNEKDLMAWDKKGQEGCQDSPTILQCPGIRIYYCGRTGYKGFIPALA
jgi:hypothetical protein